jgi:hypothetical protein
MMVRTLSLTLTLLFYLSLLLVIIFELIFVLSFVADESHYSYAYFNLGYIFDLFSQKEAKKP